MSAAVAEPPAPAQAEAVASEIAKQPGGPIKLEIGGIVAGLKQKQAEQKVTPPVTAEVKTEAPKEEQPKETPKEVPREQPKEAPKAEPEIKHNAGHFKVVTEARDAALAERDALKKQLEALQAEHEPVKASAAKLTDFEKRMQEIEKERDEYREKVRTIDITLDPQFNKEFTEPVVSAQNEVLNLLVKAGVTKEEAINAVNSWDDNGFAEVTAGLNDIQKRRIDAQILETERLAKLRTAQITKPEDYNARRQQQQEQMTKRAQDERLQFAQKVESELLEATPALKEESHAPMLTAMRTQLVRAARGEIHPKEIMAKLAQAEALQYGLAAQHAELVEMSKQLEERDKKIADLEAFVKANGSASLRSEAGGGTNGEAYVPMASRLTVRAG